MRPDFMLLLVFFIVIPCLSFSAPFSFSKDSVIAKSVSGGGKSDTVIMKNTTSDTLRIDSIMVLFDTSQMPQCEIDFFVEPRLSIRSSLYQFWNYSKYQSFHLVLNPNESINLMDFRFDLCVACPVHHSIAEVRVGDTIRGGLIFIRKGFKDTLKIKGVRRVSGMGNVVYFSEAAREGIHVLTKANGIVLTATDPHFFHQNVALKIFNATGRQIAQVSSMKNNRISWQPTYSEGKFGWYFAQVLLH